MYVIHLSLIFISKDCFRNNFSGLEKLHVQVFINLSITFFNQFFKQISINLSSSYMCK